MQSRILKFRVEIFSHLSLCFGVKLHPTSVNMKFQKRLCFDLLCTRLLYTILYNFMDFETLNKIHTKFLDQVYKSIKPYLHYLENIADTRLMKYNKFMLKE